MPKPKTSSYKIRKPALMGVRRSQRLAEAQHAKHNEVHGMYQNADNAKSMIQEKYNLNDYMLKKSTKLAVTSKRVCFVYDKRMLKHLNGDEPEHPEQPMRIKAIYEMHVDFNLISRMQKVKARAATTNEICLAHTRAHVDLIRSISKKDNLEEMGLKYQSVYLHPKTFECAALAAGSVLQVVDKVLRGDARSGVCIVRPPGHHAESDVPHGFCIFNNVAIAAQYSIKEYGLNRVLIVDWDVHHGNGIQHAFESNPTVLYISIHRFDGAKFFPFSEDGNYDKVGKGAGKGYNVNIPWNKRGMGDLEYELAFQKIVMPIAYEFDPQLVLVSAGFDAAIGDPLGGCKVTPEAYGLFTHWLSALANGRFILCLEGGYNTQSISYAMTMCTKSLLGDPIPAVKVNSRTMDRHTVKYKSCLETLQNCRNVQQHYWHCLAFNKPLPSFAMNENSNEDFRDAATQNLNIIQQNLQDAPGGSCDAVTNLSLEASGSQPNKKFKRLSEFLDENMAALHNELKCAAAPLRTCPHLKESLLKQAPKFINMTAPCCKCSSQTENWMCLTCCKVLCGRLANGHIMGHHLDTSHPFGLSLTDRSVWCYACASYVDDPSLNGYRNLAQFNEFGEEIASSYQQAHSMSGDTDTDNDIDMKSCDPELNEEEMQN